MQECEKLTMAQNDYVTPLSWGQKLPQDKEIVKRHKHYNKLWQRQA
jgi:hypothetical protein